MPVEGNRPEQFRNLEEKIVNTRIDGGRTHKGLGRVVAAFALACIGLLAMAVPSAFGAQQVITSAGPLDNIYLNDNLACQATHTGDEAPEFFGGTDPGACGTFIHTGELVYGPDVPAGNTVEPYSLVSQSGVTGSGTGADPYQVVTVVDVGETGLTITQTDSYVVGDEFYRTDIQVSNSTGAPITAALYHAGDCFLQESDDGYGFFDSGPGGIYCSLNANNAPADRIEGFAPLSSGSNYYESFYGSVWNAIDGTQFPNTCDCEVFQDNGAGLSWALTVPAGGSVTRSLLTAFSPTGETPPEDGVGTTSARGTAFNHITAGEAQFSAITNCDENANSRPFIVRWTEDSTTHTFRRTSTDTSTCTNVGGSDTNTGTGAGTIDGSGSATLEWTFSNDPDHVLIRITTDAEGPVVFIDEAPSALSGSPGGVWVFGELPWPAGGGE